MKGDGLLFGDRLCPQGGERTDLVDRLPDARDALRDLSSGQRRRLGTHGISGTRDGEEDHGGGNNPPEEGAYYAAFMEISSEVQSVLMPLSFPARGILWGWIAVSTLEGSGFVISRSLISGIVSFE
jgi:hypothetical protein